MNVTTKTFALISAGLLALLLSACSGGGGSKFPETLVLGNDDIKPQLVNSELTVGKNRFAFGLFDPEGFPVVDANVHLAFYYLQGGEKKMFELDAVSSVPARDAGLTEVVAHVHTDGTVHNHFNVGEQVGLYTAMVDFPAQGEWGVEIKIDAGDLKQTLRPRFRVSNQATTVPIGHDAPRSRNLTVNDVPDLAQLDTSANPSPEMHTTTVADAIAAQKPLLLLFASPGYCTSQMCGPVYEIMRKLYPQYRDRVEFIHVEAYDRPADPRRDLVAAAKEWGLQSEPWFFVIDSQGKVSMKFEGPITLRELEDALRAVAR